MWIFTIGCCFGHFSVAISWLSIAICWGVRFPPCFRLWALALNDFSFGFASCPQSFFYLLHLLHWGLGRESSTFKFLPHCWVPCWGALGVAIAGCHGGVRFMSFKRIFFLFFHNFLNARVDLPVKRARDCWEILWSQAVVFEKGPYASVKFVSWINFHLVATICLQTWTWYRAAQPKSTTYPTASRQEKFHTDSDSNSALNSVGSAGVQWPQDRALCFKAMLH